jgi:membrane protein implicated in regulation of membrane protease activity
MGELTGIGTLNCVYFFLFALGVGYALIAVVLGGLSHIEVPGVDIDIPGIDLHPGEPDIHLELPFSHDISHDVDHPDVGLSPLSPITIATFITTFGGVGLIINNLPIFSGQPWIVLKLWLGLPIAIVSGLGLAGLMFVLYTRLFSGVQGTSQVQAGELVGRQAEVTAPIPKGQVGEIVLVARGARVRSPARSADGEAVSRGTIVEIVGEAGNVVVVRAKKSAESQSPQNKA